MKLKWLLVLIVISWISAIYATVIGTPDQYYGSNADNPLNIPSYAPYQGINEIVHPDVVEVPEGWNGYRYWMVYTPYPNSDATYENPCIAVSNNNVDWITPPGLVNPVDSLAASPTDYNSDPDMLLSTDKTTMYLFWRRYKNGFFEKIYLRSSTDGIHWINKTELISVLPSAETLISPAVVYNGTQYLMWTMDKHAAWPSPRVIYMRTATSPSGPWSAPIATDIAPFTIAQHKPETETWHLNVAYFNNTYWMIDNVGLSNYSQGQDLYLGSSTDGTHWSFGTHPVVYRRDPYTYWDRLLYRACIIPYNDGQQLAFKLWYSVMRKNSTPWRIGYSEIYCAPRNVRINITGANYTLTWNALANVYGLSVQYKVQQSSNINTGWTDANSWSTNMIWNLPSLGTVKFYRVLAKVQ